MSIIVCSTKDIKLLVFFYRPKKNWQLLPCSRICRSLDHSPFLRLPVSQYVTAWSMAEVCHLRYIRNGASKIRPKLLWQTTRKSHTHFRLYLNQWTSMTLNDWNAALTEMKKIYGADQNKFQRR